jgi:rubrerythrin
MRIAISAEYEAIQFYTQLAESIDDKITAKVFRDVADEERVHAGEFLRALKHLTEDEERFHTDDTEEVEEYHHGLR